MQWPNNDYIQWHYNNNYATHITPKHTKKQKKIMLHYYPPLLSTEIPAQQITLSPQYCGTGGKHPSYQSCTTINCGPPLHHNSTSCHLFVRCHCIPWTLADLSPNAKQSTASPPLAVNLPLSPMLNTTSWGQFCANDKHRKHNYQVFATPTILEPSALPIPPIPPQMAQQFHSIALFLNPPQHHPCITTLQKCIALYFLMASKK